MKSKGEAYNKWERWVRLVEWQTGKKVKKIRTNNGFEFVSQQWKKALDKAGIELQTSALYIPEQNEVAECPNGTLNKMALSMLLDADLPCS